jgi:hypothetical protein
VVANGQNPVAFLPTWDYNPELQMKILDDSYFHYVPVDEGLHVISVRGSELTKQFYLLGIENAMTVLQIF